jgi:photosynthetic reaction center cytochrome c subunit
MKLGLRRTVLSALVTTSVCLLGIALALAGGQAAPGGQGQARPSGQAASARPAGAGQAAPRAPAATGDKPPMAEDVFKNVQVLKGISESEFMQTMGFFSGSLGESCEFCHVADAIGSWPHYADETPLKATTRRMVLMMNAINKANFGGRREVTCYSCHRGDQRPRVMPSLTQIYAEPIIEEQDLILKGPKDATADPIFAKYIQALGGAQKLAALTSFTAKGTYQGYVGEENRSPLEIFAKAPGQRTTILHSPNGDTTWACDGRSAWVAAPETDRPVPITVLTGGDVDGAKFDAALFFPASIKQSLTDWRVGFPMTIDNNEVQVVQGTTASRAHIKLYFDSKTGLLVREIRITDSAVGLIPTKTDFADYRDVSGVKLPFRITQTWLDGRTITQLSGIQPNVAIDAAKFAKPSPPPPPKQ